MFNEDGLRSEALQGPAGSFVLAVDLAAVTSFGTVMRYDVQSVQ